MDKVAKIVSQKIQEMNRYLNHHSIDSHLRERLQEQLHWLKLHVRDEGLDHKYDWVVENFNNLLQLPKEEQFQSFDDVKKAA